MLRRRLLRVGTLGSLALAGSAVYVMLTPPEADPLDLMPVPDPDRVSPLAPIAVPALEGFEGFATTDITHPVLLNVFASWCAPCVLEAPVLNALRRQGVILWGIAFRDRSEAIGAFLDRHGNPFSRIGFDPNGSATTPLALNGVPETMLVDSRGMIRWRWPAGITEDMARDVVLPRWRALT